jgi:hypothetical protein
MSLSKDEIEYLERLLEDNKRTHIACQNWSQVDSIDNTIKKLNEVRWSL